MINFPNDIKQIFDVFYQYNFQCYLVGGCVRDSIMGVESFDFDISTDAKPDDLMKLFSHLSPKAMYPYGVSFRVEEFSVEITTMRLESTASDGRHPNTIQYTSKVSEDILRRDFTMNALYYSPNTGIIDLLGGVKDIKEGIIKSVGTPSFRLVEDYVRILRLLSFQSRFGFEVDKDLKESANNLAGSVDKISSSQLHTYFNKIIIGPHILKVKDDFRMVLKHIIYELKDAEAIQIESGNSKKTLYDYTFQVVKTVNNKIELKYAALFHKLGLVKETEDNETGAMISNRLSSNSQSIAKQYLEYFKISKKSQKRIYQLIEMVDIQTIDSVRAMQRFIYEFGFDAVEDCLNLKKSIYRVLDDENNFNCYNLFREVIDNKYPLTMNDLVVKTEDLEHHGIPMRFARSCLSYAFVAYLSGALENSASEIIDYCKGVYHDQYSIQ